MKQLFATMLTTMVLLVSFSVASASPGDNFAASSAWQQEFATEAEAEGLEQAIKDARAEGKTVSEIISASLAAGFGDHAIITALVNANTGRAEIISAAAEAGLDMQVVIDVLGGSEPPLEPSHPDSTAGGADIPLRASPATF